MDRIESSDPALGRHHPRAVAAQGYVFLAVDAADAVTGRRAAGIDSVADETAACITRMADILALRGLALSDVIRINCYLADNSMRPEFWAKYNEMFEPGPFPVRCTYSAGIPADCRMVFDAVALDHAG